MWTIRSEQVEAFERAQVPQFEERMLVYLRKFFPKEVAFLGEEILRSTICYGQERAHIYGVTAERGLRMYITLMLALGSNYDDDPQVPWAAAILNDPSLADERVRVDRLYTKATDYVEHVRVDYQGFHHGLDSTGAIEELRKIRHEPHVILTPMAVPEFADRSLRRFQRCFPEKCKYVGKESLRNLVQRAIHSAGRYGITTERGVTIYGALMFMLGSGIDREPLLPWVAAILKDPAITDQTRRVDQLYGQALKALKQWWARPNEAAL